MTPKTIYKGSTGKQKIEAKYEKYLATLPFEVERDYIDTSFGTTHVLKAGPREGKPVFIFQGGNCINPMTLRWFSQLVKKYRIYAPDTVGHPGYSAESRISAKNQDFANWIQEMILHYQIKNCAFIGPSYGGGIILRLATFLPELINCAVLVSPAGITLGSKSIMIKKVLLPLINYRINSSDKHLNTIAHNMSEGTMKPLDKEIIGDVFQYVKLEQDMPKLTNQKELENFLAPTLVITGAKDIFFPGDKLEKSAKKIIPNLIKLLNYDMGHFPSETHLKEINKEIEQFLRIHYK
ncbi:alpha/beta fold hydrolase [Gracilibacillus salinarum]|uniref:Alpha/beta hydrolase n=1 Tax=Gracilibacillus salinarum TaxID=2932255 RepID=A0ABY4GTK8_9BACI|nr:alpha/beta hydrolase [Gracilibacillus salinarum]UOQ86557.1 alpha/beta hydrolase [Gracilibacillus salinarum]